MGDAQSAQREGKKDAAAEEESGKVEDAPAEHTIEDKPLMNNGQISEINGKADGTIAEVNGHCKDEIAAEAILTPEEDVSETEKPLKEDAKPLENVEVSEKTSPTEADANEDGPLELTEMDAKQNDINEGFRRFFSNIGLKLTVKRGSMDIATDVPDKNNKEEPNVPEDVKDTTSREEPNRLQEETAKETICRNAEQTTDVNAAQETYDNDSTTCPTLTDATSEDVLESALEKATETKEEVESQNADAATSPPVGEDEHEDATPEEEPDGASQSNPEEEVVSPIKRFFTTGIFSGLRKKKKPAEDEPTEKELADIGKKEVSETAEQTEQDQEQDKEEISSAIEAAAVEAEHKENEIKEEIISAESAQTTDEGKSSSKDTTTSVTEPESSQEKEKVQASPLKRLLSGSSFKKFSKKPRSRRSSDAKSDSGEHVSDQLLSSTESAEKQKEESPAQPSVEAAAEEDSAWASFKKLMTPKKRMKTPTLTNEETQIPGSVEEPKPNEGEQISDQSTEEGKKRKDSSVSWEAVLCGSGRRRSRKTSDSEDEMPQIDQKQGAESPLESSTENEIIASSPKRAESPSDDDGGSAWKSFKRLVTPKRKAKDEDESKDSVQSDTEVTQDESSFSIKKLLPGRKKRKSAEKQDQVSADEADQDVSGDEDSETPAVVPLSEFDTVETEVHIQTQADIESHVPEEANYELQKDLLDQMAEPVPPCESLKTEVSKVQENYAALAKQVQATTPATNEEPDDDTESISKHQQLSDIPEEGVITETMATPASAAEEAARDDTIAEDLIEITSEAYTAPEPASGFTQADETEMISAVSQLSSESSKTSGITTPVPAEYDVLETDTLLYQVVETISVSPKEVPVCTDELSPEKIDDSASHEVQQTFAKEEPISDANTGLNVEELDAINEPATTSQTESTSEVISEIPTEEFDTAKTPVDATQEVSVTDPEESIQESEQIDESRDLVECQSEVNAAESTDISPADKEVVPEVGTLVEADQDETEPPKMDSQEADSAAIEADETREHDAQTVTVKEDQVTSNITDQIQTEDEDQPAVEVEELDESSAAQDATLDSEESGVRLTEEEVISEDMPASETGTCELKEEIEPEKEDEQEIDFVEAEQVQVTEEKEAASSMLDSETPEQEVKPEDTPAAETISDEPTKTAEHLTEISVGPEKEELPVNDSITEDVQEPEILETVQEPTLESEDGSAQSVEKEAIVEVPESETLTDEPKDETVPPADVVDASKTEPVPESEVVQDIQAPTIEEQGLVQSLEKEVESVDVPEAEQVTDEAKDQTVPLSEPVHVPNTEQVQESEVLQAVPATTSDSEVDNLLPPEKEITSEDIPAVETVIDEPKQEAEVSVEPEEKLQEKPAIAEPAQEPEVKDTVTESKTEEEGVQYEHAVTESTEGGDAQELEKQLFSKDSLQLDTGNAVAPGTAEIENVQVEQEDSIPEIVEEFQTQTAVHVPSVNEGISSAQVLEKTVFSQETSAPYAQNAAGIDEPKHEVSLSELQVILERGKETELPGSEIKTAEVTHAVVAQVVLCNLKDVSVAIPDAVIEKTSEMTEPLLETVASEEVLSEEVESAAPLMKDYITETAEELVMMDVPSVMVEVSHKIQVQAVDVDIKSLETTVDSVLEPGVTEANTVGDVCPETVEKVTQEVIQHVKEELPEIEPAQTEPESVQPEQDVTEQPDTVTKVSEVVESEANEVEDQKAVEESLVPTERQDEPSAAISDVSATEQQVLEDLVPTLDLPESVDVSVHQKEDLEEPKAEQEKLEAGVKAEEVKPSSEEIREQTQITQVAQSQIAIPSNTGLVVPQNTGIISSVGNVESPSSLSLEFKLNIQFGQSKAPFSPPPVTESVALVKQTDVSEVGVQAVDAEEPIKQATPTQSSESQTQTESSSAAVQATEIPEPSSSPDSTETAVTTTQSVQQDVGIQAIKAAEPAEQIESTEIATSTVQATETMQPMTPAEQSEVLPSQPVVSEPCDQETKTEEPVQQIEEENDQDVWMDAEEGDYTQEETEEQLFEKEEPQDPQTGSEQEEEAGLGHEIETAPDSTTEEKESQEETHKMEESGEIESENEDFAVALEDLETSTTGVATTEWD